MTEDEIALGRNQRILRKLIRDLSTELGLRPNDVPTFQPILILAMLAVWRDGREYQKGWDDDDLTPVVNVFDHSKTSNGGKKRPKPR